MGLLSIIKKQKLKDKEIRCLILGLDNSGKSTVVNKLLPDDEQQSKITPTIGFQIHTIVYHDIYNISLWDIGGQSTLRPFWDNYFDKTNALIWCVDISLPIRFDESFTELRSLILRDENRIGYECHLIVLLNKIDLLDRSDTIVNERITNIKKGIAGSFGLKVDTDLMLRNANIDFIECSGITGEGIRTLKDCLASVIDV